jgi:hypothetical protein
MSDHFHLEPTPTFIRRSEAACGPLGPEDVSGWQLRIPTGFSTGPHCQDHTGLLETNMAESGPRRIGRHVHQT